MCLFPLPPVGGLPVYSNNVLNYSFCFSAARRFARTAYFWQSLLVAFASVSHTLASDIQFQRQLLSIAGETNSPAWKRCRFVHLNTNAPSGLLVIDETNLWVYRQRSTGFSTVPDQKLELPPHTGWFGVADVDTHPGLELVVSTAEAISCFRQKDGAFEQTPRVLIKGAQPFTNGVPRSISFPPKFEGTNAFLPLLTASEAIPYAESETGDWRAATPRSLLFHESYWQTTRSEWALGSQSAHSLHISKSFRPGAPAKAKKEPENEGIKKLLDDFEKEHAIYQREELDLNGDGRKDLAIWRFTGTLDPRTDVYVFLRGPENKMPEHPNQILHCSGFPVQAGSNQQVSAFCDLAGTGSPQLVLVSIRTILTSSSAMMDLLLSHGVDVVMNIRSFHRDGFGKAPDATVELTAMLAPNDPDNWFLIDGDFNGDGRRDFLVRRHLTEWDAFTSFKGPEWFREKPQFRFDIPFQGYFLIEDVNGDGISDLVAESSEDSRLCIFLSGRNK